MKITNLCISGLIGILSIGVPAQLDPTFGTSGIVTTNVNGSDKSLASFVLPDGKILVVSQSVSTSSVLNHYFVRYNSNGTLDASYGNGGITQITVPFISSTNRAIAKAIRQTDGKIVLAGDDNDNGLFCVTTKTARSTRTLRAAAFIVRISPSDSATVLSRR